MISLSGGALIFSDRSVSYLSVIAICWLFFSFFLCAVSANNGHENVSENLLLFPAQKNICCFPRRHQEVYLRYHPKTSSRPACKTSSGRVFKTRLQDQGVFKKAFCRQVFKTFWRPLERQKNCYGEDVFDTSSPKWMFAGHNRFSIFKFLKLFKDFFALHPNYYLYAENIIFPVFFQKGEQLKIVIKTTWINCKS